MKTTFIYSIYAVALVSAAGICHAQTIDLKPAPAQVIIDGNAAEWGDLPYTNDKAKISYTISNDKDNLYLVVKTKDPVKQGNIIGSGITFSIDTKGRKKSSYTITFPLNEQDEETEYMNMLPAQMQAKAALTKYRKIGVTGFSAISDATLGTSNPYGIQVAVSYDETGGLIYEEAVPLTLFNSADAVKKEWAFNIKINGLETKIKAEKKIITVNTNAQNTNATISSGRNNDPASIGMGMGGHGFDNAPKFIPLTPPVNFWGKFNLAKTL